MLIIGHRGGGGNLPENTVPAIEAGIKAGADIVHVDVRMLNDRTLVLLHDASLKRTHNINRYVGELSYLELKKLTGKHCPPTLESILNKYLGKILLDIELRSDNIAPMVIELLRHYGARRAFENTIVSSFKASELVAARHLEPASNLALLQGNNPFAFVALERSLHFAAVGFHRLHANFLAIEIARKAGIFTYAYTANRSKALTHLADLNLDGIATDYPERIVRELQR